MGMEVFITKPQGVVPAEVWRCPEGSFLPAASPRTAALGWPCRAHLICRPLFLEVMEMHFLKMLDNSALFSQQAFVSGLPGTPHTHYLLSAA